MCEKSVRFANETVINSERSDSSDKDGGSSTKGESSSSPGTFGVARGWLGMAPPRKSLAALVFETLQVLYSGVERSTVEYCRVL